MTNSRKTGAALLTSGLLVGGLLAGAGTATAAGNGGAKLGDLPGGGTQVQTTFRQLNNSGVRGTAVVTTHGRRLTVDVNAHGLLQNMPHAMHLHFSPNSSHTCPTVRDDANHDHRLSTSEGGPDYGMVRASLTTRGAHGAGSALAVTRFPTAPNGAIHYHRTIRVGAPLARAVRRGEVAVVIHGIDYNQNGKYDFSAGKSDLDPKLPTEATDPVACGVLHRG